MGCFTRDFSLVFQAHNAARIGWKAGLDVANCWRERLRTHCPGDPVLGRTSHRPAGSGCVGPAGGVESVSLSPSVRQLGRGDAQGFSSMPHARAGEGFVAQRRERFGVRPGRRFVGTRPFARLVRQYGSRVARRDESRWCTMDNRRGLCRKSFRNLSGWRKSSRHLPFVLCGRRRPKRGLGWIGG